MHLGRKAGGMTTIKLVDARRGLNLKCRELFRDEKISEAIYRYLCDGIEECDDVEPERKKGRWKVTPIYIKCSECGESFMLIPQNYCPNCGAEMRGEQDEG